MVLAAHGLFSLPSNPPDLVDRQLDAVDTIVSFSQAVFLIWVVVNAVEIALADRWFPEISTSGLRKVSKVVFVVLLLALLVASVVDATIGRWWWLLYAALILLHVGLWLLLRPDDEGVSRDEILEYAFYAGMGLLWFVVIHGQRLFESWILGI